jgi:DNA (cytosine-5)-methyltransferase 1
MRYISLFSGIEAATVAWHPLGWDCAAVAEIEPFPCALLAHKYPSVPNLGDVTKVTAEDIKALGPIDLVVFGSPCQDLSVAGKRKGLAGARSGLFHTALDIVDWAREHCGARWALWENVPGAFSSQQGRDFATVVAELAGLAECAVPPKGWGNEGAAVGEKAMVEWSTLDAQWFGVAQRRRRVFALADFGDWAGRCPILLEPSSLSGDTAPRRGAGERIANCLGVSPASSSSPNIGNGQGNVVEVRGFDVLNHTTDDVAHTLSARADMQVGCVFPTYEVAGPLTAGMHKGPRGTEAVDSNHLVAGVSVPYETLTFSSEMSEPSWGVNISETLKTTCPPAVAFAQNTRDEVREMAVVGALAANPGMKQTSYIRQNTAVRRLTPIECERLQGFPDGYTDIPYRGKPAADAPRYKALGNSMAVPVMRWIAQSIDNALTIQEMT